MAITANDPGSENDELTAINRDNPVMHVKHSELTRFGDSRYCSNCPVCKRGILHVGRNPVGFLLLSNDHCDICGQEFEYDDIPNNEIAELPN